MELISDSQDFEAYFEEHNTDASKIKPASDWAEQVIDRFHGESTASNWRGVGFEKMSGMFDLRPGELTIWAGVNGHGKTTFLSHVMLNVMHGGGKVGIASLEMKPAASMAKMSRQAAGTGTPAAAYIRAFHKWTDGRLWIFDHVGTLAPNRMLGVASYMRNELGIEHIVIDSLMKCGMGTDDYTAQKNFVNSLCAIAMDTGIHVHLVCHMRKGEAESKAPDKFDVKGAGEIVDMADNLVVVWKNVRKTSKSGAEPENAPDAFVRIAKQRHFEFEGSFAFWFDKATQQYLEHESGRPTFIDPWQDKPHGGVQPHQEGAV